MPMPPLGKPKLGQKIDEITAYFEFILWYAQDKIRDS
jgi:hypothetical protein